MFINVNFCVNKNNLISLKRKQGKTSKVFPCNLFTKSQVSSLLQGLSK